MHTQLSEHLSGTPLATVSGLDRRCLGLHTQLSEHLYLCTPLEFCQLQFLVWILVCTRNSLSTSLAPLWSFCRLQFLSLDRRYLGLHTQLSQHPSAFAPRPLAFCRLLSALAWPYAILALQCLPRRSTNAPE
jgi:hypothetical protein